MMQPTTLTPPALPASVHIVGIGGMAMSGIAQLLLAAGVHVSGSDQTLTPLTARLAGQGATVYAGHAAAHVGQVEAVVTTAAARHDNPEIQEAARRGIPILSRAAMVARLMQGRTAVAVAGTHGKTTTSAMVAWVLTRAGLDPAYLLGGDSLDLGGNAAAGSGAVMVVEADEYARAFLDYTPLIAVVTNVEADHLEYYGSVRSYEDAFRQFLQRIPADGTLILCADSPRLRAIAAEPVAATVQRYGLCAAAAPERHAEVEWLGLDHGPAPEGGHRLTLLRGGEQVAAMTLRVPGAHNAANALGALAAAVQVGVSPAMAAAALAELRGVRRRFELVGEAGGVTIIDDFAHHPTEVRATLRAARERFAGRRIVVAFQPHTYSRTAYLLAEFATCFADADRLVLVETFAARESAEAGLGAQDLANAIKREIWTYARSSQDAADRLLTELRSGDVLLTIGAGDIDRAGRAVLEGLRATC